MSKTKSKQSTTGPKHAAIYVRVSSERQNKRKGKDAETELKESPRAQERVCRELAKKKGYIVVEVYRDIEKYRVGKRLVEPSATRADRPAFKQMLADARKGNFEVIVAWREDRLIRGYGPLSAVDDCLCDCEKTTGLTIELTNDYFDRRAMGYKAAGAKQELDAKHERLMMGVAGRLADGKIWNGMTPYGYRNVNGILEKSSEAEWVLDVWRWYGSGESIHEIRRRLIAAAVPQKRGGKHEWELSSIRNILKRDFYHTGIFKITWDGEAYEIPAPVIVDAETAARVQARKAAYKEYPAGNLKTQALAAGAVYCKTCGVRMVVWANKSRLEKYGKLYLYYTCPNMHREYHVPGCAKSKRLEVLDTDLWDKVWQLISEPAVFEAAIQKRIAELQAQEFDASAECEKLQKKLDALAFERQKVVTWARKGFISEDDLGTQMAVLTFEEAGLKHEIAEKSLLVGGHAERLMEVARIYRERMIAGVQVNQDPQTPEEEKALFDWRRLVVQGIVKRVDVSADKSIEVQVELDFEKAMQDLGLSSDLLYISDSPASSKTPSRTAGRGSAPAPGRVPARAPLLSLRGHRIS